MFWHVCVDTCCMLQDLRALLLIFSVQQPQQLPPLLLDSLRYIQHFCRPFQQERAARGRSREPSQEATEDAVTPAKTETADNDTGEDVWLV